MVFKDLFIKENEEIKERFCLSMDRVEQIITEDSTKEPYASYFKTVAGFIMQIKELLNNIEEGKLFDKSLNELKDYNESLYEDILPNNYDKSYGNPSYAVRCMGKEYGKLLSFLYSEIRAMIAFAYENRLKDITVLNELFIEIYNCFEDDDTPSYKELKSIVYFFVLDYSKETVEYRIRELLDPGLAFAREIIMESDLEDLRYLYSYGEYITDNELQIAKFLNQLSDKQIEEMAKTYTDAYILGFHNSRIDLSKKTAVNIRFSIGFERIVKAAINIFLKNGLEPIIYRYALRSQDKKQHIKIGYFADSANKQFDYDHRFDIGLYMDKALNDRRLSNLRAAYNKYKKQGTGYAGPAVIETFGELPFSPVSKEDCILLNDKQKRMLVDYNNESALLMYEYIKKEEYSFTIIAYPVPQIGECFKEVFHEMIKINTLDTNLYKNIQESIIKILDQGEYVHLLGAGLNKTNIKVKLKELNNPETETKFENCLADVNIPVGEVFTSPVLEGTSGILHVSRVYLNDLEYKDLELDFLDGKVSNYTCGNFQNEEENKKFIHENLLYNHETLPIGEFAIGTNTSAYVMANKYDIVYKLPILIVEKMGPHFALGDTCYSRCEDKKVLNQNGKEMIAKDNEISILRKSQKEKAYFNCHTDITIPYDELKEIAVYTKNNQKLLILENGRFVLEGTKELNLPFL